MRASNQMNNNKLPEQIHIQISLDKDIIEWIDDLKGHIGLRSRGDLINRLLREIRGEDSESDPEITT